MRAVQLNRKELVLNSTSIWLCDSCQTCTTRCPQGIDIAKVQDTLKILAREAGVAAKIPAVPAFNDAVLRSIRMYGRMYEPQVMAELNLRMKDPFRNMALARRMMSARKVKLLPSRARFPRNLNSVKNVVAEPSEVVAYYPGCSLHGSAPEFDMSTRAVAEKLGLRLQEPKGWTCCGTTPAHMTDPFIAATLPVQNLSLMEKSGFNAVTVPCAACFSRMKFAAHEIREDAELKEKVAKKIGYEYRGGVEVEHSVNTFTKRVGLDKVKASVTKPLKGLKVACYYGCLLTRPPEITGADNPEYPMNMDNLIRALGATTVEWSFKTECCGANLALTNLDSCLRLVGLIIENAKKAGAEALVVACPLCQLNLDSRQFDIAERTGGQPDMPVYYFTQLMGLAMGFDEKQIGLDKLLVDGRPLLESKGFLGSEPAAVAAGSETKGSGAA
jgi:heterodisulfide reductase subunit B